MSGKMGETLYLDKDVRLEGAEGVPLEDMGFAGYVHKRTPEDKAGVGKVAALVSVVR